MADAKFNDGGAAFPTSQDNTEYSERGISMRDYFAAKALTGLLAAMAHPASPGVPNLPESNDVFVEHAYAMADAMLAWRDRR